MDYLLHLDRLMTGNFIHRSSAQPAGSSGNEDQALEDFRSPVESSNSDRQTGGLDSIFARMSSDKVELFSVTETHNLFGDDACCGMKDRDSAVYLSVCFWSWQDTRGPRLGPLNVEPDGKQEDDLGSTSRWQWHRK